MCPHGSFAVSCCKKQELPDSPVELDDLAVDRAGGTGPAGEDLGLDLSQELGVPGRNGEFRVTGHSLIRKNVRNEWLDAFAARALCASCA